jgi:hypothetical protein
MTPSSRLILLSPQKNLLTFSEQFDNAAWIRTNTTVSANAVSAPNGSLTADKLVESVAVGFHGARQVSSASVGMTVTASFHLKAAERGWALVWFDGDAKGAYFDLSSGALGTVSAGVTATPGEVMGDGWFRCAATKTLATNGTVQIYVATANNTVSYAGDGASGIYVWGAMVNTGTKAARYRRT